MASLNSAYEEHQITKTLQTDVEDAPRMYDEKKRKGELTHDQEKQLELLFAKQALKQQRTQALEYILGNSALSTVYFHFVKELSTFLQLAILMGTNKITVNDSMMNVIGGVVAIGEKCIPFMPGIAGAVVQGIQAARAVYFIEKCERLSKLFLTPKAAEDFVQHYAMELVLACQDTIKRLDPRDLISFSNQWVKETKTILLDHGSEDDNRKTTAALTKKYVDLFFDPNRTPCKKGFREKNRANSQMTMQTVREEGREKRKQREEERKLSHQLPATHQPTVGIQAVDHRISLLTKQLGQAKEQLVTMQTHNAGLTQENHVLKSEVEKLKDQTACLTNMVTQLNRMFVENSQRTTVFESTQKTPTEKANVSQATTQESSSAFFKKGVVRKPRPLAHTSNWAIKTIN